MFFQDTNQMRNSHMYVCRQSSSFSCFETFKIFRVYSSIETGEKLLESTRLYFNLVNFMMSNAMVFFIFQNKNYFEVTCTL